MKSLWLRIKCWCSRTCYRCGGLMEDLGTMSYCRPCYHKETTIKENAAKIRHLKNRLKLKELGRDV